MISMTNLDDDLWAAGLFSISHTTAAVNFLATSDTTGDLTNRNIMQKVSRLSRQELIIVGKLKGNLAKI